MVVIIQHCHLHAVDSQRNVERLKIEKSVLLTTVLVHFMPYFESGLALASPKQYEPLSIVLLGFL